MAQNTLMFEVGVESAIKGLDQLEANLSKAVKDMQGKMNLQIEVKGLEILIKNLEQLGKGTQIQPLLDRLEALQTSMVRLGLVPQNMNWDGLKTQLDKVTTAYENYQKAREKAGLKAGETEKGGSIAALEAYRVSLSRLERDFGMTEKVARAAFETYQKSGQTAAAAIEKMGANVNTQGFDHLKTQMEGVNTSVKTLTESMSKFLYEMQKMNTAPAPKIADGMQQGTQATQQQTEAIRQQEQQVRQATVSLESYVSMFNKAFQPRASIGKNWVGSHLDEYTGSFQRFEKLFGSLDLENVVKKIGSAQNGAKLMSDLMIGLHSGSTYSNIPSEKYDGKAEVERYKKTEKEFFSQVQVLQKQIVGEWVKNLDSAKLQEFRKTLMGSLDLTKNPMAALYGKQGHISDLGATDRGVQKADIEYWDRLIKMVDKAIEVRKQYEAASAKTTTSTEKAAQAANNLANAENKPAPQGGLFDPQKFATLQEAIDKVVKEVNRLATALNGIKTDGIEALARVISGLQINANNVSSAFQNLEGKMKFQGTADEFAAYEKRIQELKTEITNLEAQAKNTAEAVKKMNNEFKSVSEKAGSETAKNKNISDLNIIIDNVSKALRQMVPEWRRLTQGGAFDAELEKRIKLLFEYRRHLKAVKDYSNISKPGALGSTEFMFNGDILNSKRYRSMYSARAIKDFAKDVDDVIGRKKAVDDMSAAFERMKQAMLGVGTTGSGGMRGVSANLETINKVGELNIQTLIKEQGHIERLIALAQKSITFGEKYDVMGMGEKRAQQRANLEYLENVKRMIDYILQNRNQPEWMRFLNTSSSLRLPLPGSGNDIALLGGHFNQLTHNVQTTAQAMRQLKADMSLESNNWYKQFNTDNLTRGLYNVETAIKNIMDAWSKVSSTASPEMAQAVAQQINNLNAVKREITAALDNQSVLGSRHGYATAMDANYYIQLKEAKVVLKDINDLNKANNTSAKESAKAQEQVAKSINIAGKAVSDLQKKYERFRNNDTFKKAFDLGIDTSSYSQAIERLLRYQRILQYIRENGGHDASRITGSAGYRDMQNNLDIQLGRLKQQVKEKERIGKITSQLAIEENRFSTAINQTTSALRGQSQIMSDLKMMATQYIGVWGAQQFIHNIIEIGGQLEKQRLSLGAILGDVSQANELFDNIKNLAIKSPFGVVELDQFTKQLSAYGFKYNELFDMTKRLADISAGAGTDVSRLALALGHVRAEGALSGYTLRQFAMNNIPMVSKLAERLTELEGRIVSVSEVRKRVSKKEIGYSDVEAVIKDLTDEGGMFYNMQETISQSVASKFKNLKDAMDIMYGEMAEGGIGDVLKLIATGLTELTREWRVLLPVIVAGTSYFGLHKLALMGVNAQITQYGVASKFLSGETYKLTAEQVKNLAVTGQISQRQLLIAVATRRLTVEQAEAAAATYGLTKAQLQQIAVSGRLDKAMLANSISTSKYTSAQLRAMTAARVSGFGPLNGLLTKLKLGWMGATAGATKFFTAMKAMGASVGWLVALEAVITLITHQFQKLEEEKERKASLLNKATEGFRNTNESSTRFKVGASVELNTTELKTQIDALKQELKEYSPQAGTVLKEAFKTDATGRNIHTLAQQYELLSKELKATRDGYQELESVSSLFETANDATGGRWYQFGLNDDIRENVEDYIGALKDQKDAEADLLRNRGKMEESVERLRKNYSQVNDIIKKNVELYKASGGKQGYAESDTMAKFRTIYEQGVAAQNTELKGLSQDDIKSVNVFRAAYSDLIWTMSHSGEELKDNWVDYQDAILTTKNKFEDFTDDAQKYTSDLVRRLEGQFNTTVDKFSTSQKRAVQLGLEAFLNGIDGFKDLTKEERDTIEKELLKPFKIEVDVELSEAYKNLDEFQQYLRSITSKNWTVNINTVTSTKDLIKSGQDSRKNMKDMEKTSAEPFKKAGISRDRIKEYARRYYEEGKQQAQKVEETVAELSTPWNPGGVSKKIEKKKSDAKKEFENYIGVVQSDIVKNNAREYFDAYIQELGFKEIEGEGYDFSDDKSKGNKSGRSEDKDAKTLRERVRIIKEAADAYQYWKDKVGESGARTHMTGEYGDLLKANGFNIENAEDLKKTLDELYEKYNKIYKSTTGGNKKRPQLLEALKEVRTTIDKELNRKDFEELSKRSLSVMNKQLDDLTRRWEIFNSVRDNTGNVALAQQMAGLTPEEMNMRNAADSMKQTLEQQYSGIDWDEVYGLDEDGIEKYVQKMGIAEDKIEAVATALKKWRDLQRDITSKDIDIFAKLIGSSVDLQTQVKKINTEFEETIKSLDWMKASGRLTNAQYGSGRTIAESKRDMELVQASKEYQLLMDGVVNMSKKAAQEIRQRYITALEKQLRAGAITAKDYAEKIQEINEKMNNLETSESYFRSYTSGGMNGLLQNIMNRGKGYTQQGAALEQEGMGALEGAKMGSEAMQKALGKVMNGNKMASMGADMMQGAQGAMGAMAIIDAIVHGIDDLVQGLKGTFDEIREMFDALGTDTESDGWQDANTFFSSFSAASASATKGWDSLKNGDVGGTIEGVVGSFTNWFTGFAKGHDAKREKHIQDLKREVSMIGDTLEQIRNYRERELGYNSGELRRKVGSQYDYEVGEDGRIIYRSVAQKAMDMYYGKSEAGTGYQQELAGLEEQRKKYMKMYEEEEDKKDSSDEALQEYKNQIADLDEQILYFVEDLTKELWGIDFKGWSEQISDAIWTAFENGEDAIDAFHDAASDIIADVAKKMMNLHFIEPVFQALEDELFGTVDSNGNRVGTSVYNYETGELNENRTLEILGKFFGEGGPMMAAIAAGQDFYNLAQSLTGFDFSEGGSTSSKIIQGGFTEDETGLLLSYMNAIRADVSINRQMIGDYFPQFLQALTYGNQSLWNIENHTAAIMRSNDNIQQAVQDLQSDFRGLKNRTWSLPVS